MRRSTGGYSRRGAGSRWRGVQQVAETVAAGRDVAIVTSAEGGKEKDETGMKLRGGELELGDMIWWRLELSSYRHWQRRWQLTTQLDPGQWSTGGKPAPRVLRKGQAHGGSIEIPANCSDPGSGKAPRGSIQWDACRLQVVDCLGDWLHVAVSADMSRTTEVPVRSAEGFEPRKQGPSGCDRRLSGVSHLIADRHVVARPLLGA